MSGIALDGPEPGQLVRARGQQWVVAGVSQSQQPVDELAASRVPGRPLVQLSSVSDDDLGEELTLVWEIEPGREIVPATSLPKVTEDGWDDPQRLGAFLDAVRWGADRGIPVRTGRAGAGAASGELADRRRCRAGEDDRGRLGDPGDAAPTPGPPGHSGVPGVADAEVA